MTDLFELAKEKAIKDTIEDDPEPQSQGYIGQAVGSDVKSSIIDITPPTDARLKNLLTKELVLSNLKENEIRICVLFNNLVMDFVAEGEAELAAEWHERMIYWLLAKRSIGFKQQEILATQIRQFSSKESNNQPKSAL